MGARLPGMGPWMAAAVYLIDLALKIVALGVVPKNRRPASGMAWMLLILVLPGFGWVIFLVLGRTKLRTPAQRAAGRGQRAGGGADR